jgi:hypothetical protein
VAQISQHTDLDFRGTAQFEFFNDQLVSVTFFPENVDEYKKALEEKGFTFELNSLNVWQSEAPPDTEVVFYPSNGSFRSADRELELITAKRLAGEY